MGDQPPWKPKLSVHKTAARWAETIPSFSQSASTLLSIKAGWLCPGKISRRFILSSQCSWLRDCPKDNLGASPQEKIKLVVSFHFTSNASYQTSQLMLTNLSYYWLKGGSQKKWPRGKDLCIFDQLSSSPLKQQILNWKTVRNRAGEEFNTIPWSKIYYHLYLPIEYQNSLGWKGFQELTWSILLLKENPNRAGCSFSFWISSRVNSLSAPPVSMTALTMTFFFLYIEKSILWLLPPLKDLNLRRVSQELSELFIQNTFRLEDISLTKTKGFSRLNFTTFHKIEVK